MSYITNIEQDINKTPRNNERPSDHMLPLATFGVHGAYDAYLHRLTECPALGSALQTY